jgi:hypothetical protein
MHVSRLVRPYRTWWIAGALLLSVPLQSVLAGTPTHCPVNDQLSDCLTKFLEQSLDTNTGYRRWTADHTRDTDGVRRTGPFLNGTSAATHARSRVYYSDAVVAWLRKGRNGAIADNSTVIKEMYVESLEPGKVDAVTGWAVMLRNSQGSHDGWTWVLFYRPGNATNGRQFIALQQGMTYCLACHASTDTNQLTFASLGNIDATDIHTYAYFDPPEPLRATAAPTPPAIQRDTAHSQFAAQQSNCALALPGDLPPPRTTPNPAIRATFPLRPIPDPSKVTRLPMDAYFDHVPVPATPDKTFLSADDCSGCHDASALAGNMLPEMMVATATNEQYNLSPWGEWSGSMMGLAARDPIFLAQLESEIALRPERAEYIQEFCLSCHAVQGARQLKAESGAVFTKDMLYATPGPGEDHAAVGALGRSGVACTICHRITADGLGTPASFNAGFHTGPAGEIYGPFDSPLTWPMQQAVGLTPKHGAQLGSSALCGSCHTVIPRAIGRGMPGPPSSFKPVHEQTTYLEWLNSDFKDGGPAAQSCAQCHMPGDFHLEPGKPLAFRIANVEDGRFPAVPHRAPDADVTLTERPYRRHTLVGVNAFGLQLFEQFPDVLGHCVFDAAGPFLAPGEGNIIPRIALAGDEAVRMAAHAASLDIRDVKIASGKLLATVRVTNRTGHKFPSGVGFRRAVLQLALKDGQGGTLWESGGMNAAGVLVDASGSPLPSEFTSTPEQLLPDYALITRRDQVQVYEQRHTDELGLLTTSFLSLFNEVKDNRILPAGWTSSGPYADVTRPVADGKPAPNPIAGYDDVHYSIPLSFSGGVARVEATLLYQSTPPYYLADRFATLGPENDRLMSLVAYVDLDATPLQGFRLVIDSAAVSVP